MKLGEKFWKEKEGGIYFVSTSMFSAQDFENTISLVSGQSLCMPDQLFCTEN